MKTYCARSLPSEADAELTNMLAELLAREPHATSTYSAFGTKRTVVAPVIVHPS
jgi:hypothetical protein